MKCPKCNNDLSDSLGGVACCNFCGYIEKQVEPKKEACEIKQLTLDQLREQFEKTLQDEYNMSDRWLERYETGNYKNKDIERDWLSWKRCSIENNILIESEINP